ncbi:MAG: PQQ-binding-like beta-propeller repeat protein [Bacteroidetes Order II. Incertae sedis bacterium]|jgi:outer membrane protein assembly factor BamB|nr:PQQ-binding-like beta-propeller repeat protein [Bacteroidetes Order II. bacterium]MBT4602193.1 PQQ-binding-like beta-propeller repeat protein [Bacteroidetes Order II. bacterium]MBT5250556.1 PQQ-binding-like beta-propeller repeat protein [Bacteroidetes Order II. bacterium]MBT6201233.1 PQQ-binding-like beta-propeller repeat protein [Bacteroidetes Order II. bacterium]MBT6424201.1 PQQ-binding-like beta-propeller repeat protein [Bacteroidetes Order II. bacterium]
MRIRIPHIVLLLFLSSCQTIQFENPSIVSDSDWLVDGQSQERTRAYAFDAALPFEEAWEYNAAAAFGPGSPLILEGVILAATRKGEVHTVELATGRKRGFKSFSDGIEGSPAIDNGRMFISSAVGKRTLVAWDLKRGRKLWRYKGSGFESGLVVQDNMVIGADVDAVVKAFDQADGTLLWTRSLGEMSSVQSTPLLVNLDRLFVADDRGNAFLLNVHTGDVIWESLLTGPVYESATAADGLVFVPTTRGAIDALDLHTGQLVWTLTQELSTLRFGGLATDGKHVYAGATDGLVRAVDVSTGEVVWSSSFPDVISAAPLVTDRHIFVGSMGKMIYGLNRETGAVEWDAELKGRVKSAMAATQNGIVVLSEPRYITYFTSSEGSDVRKK